MTDRTFRRDALRSFVGAALAVVLLTLFASMPSTAATWPVDFERLHVAPSATLTSPVALAFAPDGRIFVAERRGTIQVLLPDSNAVDPRVDYLQVATPFLDIQSEVLNHWDRGLLGLALDPDFVTNGWVYFAYMVETDPGTPDQYQFSYTRIERVQVAAADSNAADLATRQILVGDTWPNGITSAHFSHTTGRLVFGDDKTLLFAHGDGAHFNGDDAGGRDPDQFLPGRTDPIEDVGAFRSQFLGSMSGKILRMDKDTGLGLPSNPWYDSLDPSSSQSRTWAMGLRNPYRMDIVRGSGSSNPADGNPGRLYIGDVGYENWEEVNVSDGGENFGWPCYEGSASHTGYQGLTPAHSGCPPDNSGMTPPLLEWPHANRPWDSAPLPGLVGNAATGAALHAGNNYPLNYRNLMYFCDYTRNWIHGVRLDPSGAPVEIVPFGTGLGQPVELRFDPVSEDLFYLSYADNRIYRFSYSGPTGAGVNPLPPTGVSGTPGLGEVSLTWDLSSELDVVGYNVLRSSDGGSTWVQLNAQPITVPRYTDSGNVQPILTGEVYEYAVEAFDDEIPSLSSGMSTPVAVAVTSKAWDWYAPFPGASFSLDRSPAPFPRTVHLDNPSNLDFNHWTTVDRAAQLRRYGVTGDFVLETHVDLVNSTRNKLFMTGLTVGFGQFDLFYWGIYRGTSLTVERSGSANILSVAYNPSSVWLRIVRTGSTYSFEYRELETDPWTVLGTQVDATPSQFVGYIAKTWQSAVPFDLRIDYLAVDELPPVAAAGASTLNGPTPLSIDFSSSSYDPDGDLLFHDWDFGDGGVSQAAAPTHAFTNVGNYPVVLTVTDAVGLVARDTLVVVAEGNHAPVATIDLPLGGFEYIHPDSSIVLSATGTDAEDPADSLSFDWSVDLLDGGSRTPAYATPTAGQLSSLIPATAGNVELDVILTVTDTGGLSDSDTVRVVDASLPPPAVLDLQAALADGVSAPITPTVPASWTNLVDVANGPHATLVNFGVASPSSGFHGAGIVGDPYRLEFDGLDDVVTVAPAVLALPGATGASVELWLRTPSDIQTRGYVLEWLESYSSPFAGMTLAVEAGKLRLYRSGWSDLAPVQPDTWLHVIAAKDSSTYTVWVDGSEVSTGAGSFLGAQNSELVIGAGTFAGPGQYSNPFGGAIAELRVYDRALSEANVSVLSAVAATEYANPPVLLSASPSSVTNDQTLLSTTLSGRHFRAGAEVRAMLAGESDLVASSVVAVSDSTLQVQLPVLGATTGNWDLRVTNPDSQGSLLPAALIVRDPSPWLMRFDASLADGSVPPVVPGATAAWTDTVSAVAANLMGFDGTSTSGWSGDGSLGGPWALRFDGSDDIATVDSLAMSAIDSVSSFELWVAPASAAPGFHAIAQWGRSVGGSWRGWSLATQDSNYVLRYDVQPQPLVLGPVLAGQFAQLVVNVDRDSVVCYFDGAVVASIGRSIIAVDGADLRLGASVDGLGALSAHFAGDIAVLGVGSRALTAQEVSESYAASSGRFAAPTAAKLSLVPSDLVCSTSDSVDVSLVYDDQGFGFGLRAAQIDLDFDPTALELVSWSQGSFFANSGVAAFVSADTAQSGKISFDVAALGQTVALMGSGELVRMRFAVRDSASEGVTQLVPGALSLLDGGNPASTIPSIDELLELTLDFTPPLALTTLGLHTGVGAVATDWVAPASDYAGARVFVRPWSIGGDEGHPEYDDLTPAPPWPVSLAEARNPANGWSEFVVGAQGTSFTYLHAQRTVVSAIVIAEDAAGNLSDFASAPRGRVVNYPLGDVGALDAAGAWMADYDGRVDGAKDVPVFSKAYATNAAGAGYFAVCDMGPTADGSIEATPATDDVVDFEDLVIFSQSFGSSNLSRRGAAVLSLGEAASGVLRVELGDPELQGDPSAALGRATLRVPLRIAGNPGIVRAAHVELGFDEQKLSFVGFQAGPVLEREQESALYFLQNRGGGRLEFDVAALGQQAYFDGDGVLGVLHFEMKEGVQSTLDFLDVDLRSTRGEKLDVDSQGLVGTSIVPLPSMVRLFGATPNPFNPTTTLRFELPHAGDLRLNVYSVSGRLVRRLANGEWPAGYHRVSWRGLDDRGQQVSSGVYLYELVFDGQRNVRKMMLVK